MPRQAKKREGRLRPQPTPRRAQITTYYRSDNDPAALSPFKKKPPKKNHRKLLLGTLDIALLAAVLLSVGYGLVLNNHPKLTVTSSSYRPALVYQQAVDASFSSFKNHNKISFDEQGVSRTLSRRFPEIRGVQVELPFFSQTAKVTLDIAKPSFRLSSGGSLYIVDADGVVTARAAELPSLSKLILVTDQSGYGAKVGQPVLSSQAVAFIDTVIAQCQRAKVPLASLILPAVPQEIDLRTSDQGYFTKFYLGGDPDLQTGQFLAARSQFSKTGQPPSQYLDVRVSGKIFYK